MFRFLIALPRTDIGKHPDGGEMAIAKMAGDVLGRFFSLVETSPTEERTDNPSLRMALKTKELGLREVEVRLFSRDVQPAAPTS